MWPTCTAHVLIACTQVCWQAHQSTRPPIFFRLCRPQAAHSRCHWCPRWPHASPRCRKGKRVRPPLSHIPSILLPTQLTLHALPRTGAQYPNQGCHPSQRQQHHWKRIHLTSPHPLRQQTPPSPSRRHWQALMWLARHLTLTHSVHQCPTQAKGMLSAAMMSTLPDLRPIRCGRHTLLNLQKASPQLWHVAPCTKARQRKSLQAQRVRLCAAMDLP
jgi:hypothetical protein